MPQSKAQMANLKAASHRRVTKHEVATWFGQHGLNFERWSQGKRWSDIQR